MTTPSLRIQSFRHVARLRISPLPPPQRRWAQVHDVRFIATHREPERIQDKYRDKLDKKAKEEGLSSIGHLKEAYKDKISELRRQAETIPPLSNTVHREPPNSTPFKPHSPFPPPPPPPKIPSAITKPSTTPGGVRPLSSYLDLEKTQALSAKEIEAIWRLRHAGNPSSLCACIPLDLYNRIAETAKRYPQFILPLPRPAAESPAPASSSASASDSTVTSSTPADIHFLQWHFPADPDGTEMPPPSTVLFTHLSEYKLRGEYATPHTTITHHLDLASSKGIILLNGMVSDGKAVNVDEGRWLVMCLQRFYGGMGENGERRKELVEMFGRGDVSFDLEELVEEASKIT